MMFVFSPLLFSLLLFCTTQTLGVKIHSNLVVNSEGVIHTELEQTVSLLCMSDSDSGAQEDELVWLRNEDLVQLKEGNKKGKSTVCVTPVIVDDGATFTCRLRANATDKTSVTLKVTYGPQLSGSEEVMAKEESALTLKCDILANPPVSSVSWTLNGSSVDLLAGSFTVVSDGHTSQLSTSSIEKSLHEGTYQCIVQSPMYGEYSKNFTVTVTDKTMMFPLMPLIAGLVVVVLTTLLAVVSRWKKIIKCCK